MPNLPRAQRRKQTGRGYRQCAPITALSFRLARSFDEAANSRAETDVAQVGHVLALLFKGLQVLFHVSARERAAPAKQGCGGS